MPAARALAPTLLLLCGPAAASARAVPAANDSPWQALASLRRALSQQTPLEARFVQTFTPAGFTDGEREAGTLLIDLPRCLRWSYRGELARNFLLCDQTIWAWSEGETVGERFTLENRDAPGLDFLIYDTADIESRYQARVESDPRGRQRIKLEPLHPTEDVVAAFVTLDAKNERLLELRYLDREGNENVFVLSDYRRTGRSPAAFSPPRGVAWEEP